MQIVNLYCKIHFLFAIFQENRALHFMRAVGDELHETSGSVSKKKKKKKKKKKITTIFIICFLQIVSLAF